MKQLSYRSQEREKLLYFRAQRLHDLYNFSKKESFILNPEYFYKTLSDISDTEYNIPFPSNSEGKGLKGKKKKKHLLKYTSKVFTSKVLSNLVKYKVKRSYKRKYKSDFVNVRVSDFKMFDSGFNLTFGDFLIKDSNLNLSHSIDDVDSKYIFKIMLLLNNVCKSSVNYENRYKKFQSNPNIAFLLKKKRFRALLEKTFEN